MYLVLSVFFALSHAFVLQSEQFDAKTEYIYDAITNIIDKHLCNWSVHAVACRLDVSDDDCQLENVDNDRVKSTYTYDVKLINEYSNTNELEKTVTDAFPEYQFKLDHVLIQNWFEGSDELCNNPSWHVIPDNFKDIVSYKLTFYVTDCTLDEMKNYRVMYSMHQEEKYDEPYNTYQPYALKSEPNKYYIFNTDGIFFNKDETTTSSSYIMTSSYLIVLMSLLF